jgi:phage terminase large subunit
LSNAIKVKFNSSKLLKENQHTIFHDESRFKVAACGRRFGKSYLATYIIITKALQHKGIYFFVAPTFSQARQILWEILKNKVRGRLSTKINETRLEVTLINGSVILLKGADRPDTMRGVSLSGVVCDEFSTMREPEVVWQQVLRPALSDQKGWAVFISSPSGRNYMYDLYNQAKTNDDWKSWQFTTLDGGYVDEDEIKAAMNDLDERTFRQEYLSSFESFDGLVVPNFDRELNSTTESITEDDTLIFGIDFNINLMPCIVFVKRGDELHAVDEFFGSFNTAELMEAINLRYPKLIRSKKIFHTDASGVQNRSSAGGATDITIVKGYGRVMNLTKNPNIIDRVNACNSMVCSTDRTRRVFVSAKCKRLLETLEKHVFDDNGMPNKKHAYHDDVFDAFSYATWHYSSYGKSQLTSQDFIV